MCGYNVTASVKVLTLESKTDLENSWLGKVQSATFSSRGQKVTQRNLVMQITAL